MNRLSTLWALRIFGPLTTSELCRRTGDDRYATNIKAEALMEKGLAEMLPNGKWDITINGRAMVTGQLRALKLLKAPEPVRKLCRWPFPPTSGRPA